MASEAVDRRPSRPLLTLGGVDLLRINVGYRSTPEDPAYEWFLLDLPVPDRNREGAPGALDEARVLAALEPVLYVGADAPRHYSLHQHRRHTSWGASPGALELGLLVTAGPRSSTVSKAAQDSVTLAFRDLLALGSQTEPTPIPRDAAILRARRSAADNYTLDPDTLSLSAEEHHPAENSWSVRLRAAGGDEYDVLVGFVDGYAGTVRVRHERRLEVFDSVGSE